MIKDLKEVREDLEKIAAKEHMSYAQAAELPFSFDTAKEALAKLDAIIRKIENPTLSDLNIKLWGYEPEINTIKGKDDD